MSLSQVQMEKIEAMHADAIESWNSAMSMCRVATQKLNVLNTYYANLLTKENEKRFKEAEEKAKQEKEASKQSRAKAKSSKSKVVPKTKRKTSRK